MKKRTGKKKVNKTKEGWSIERKKVNGKQKADIFISERAYYDKKNFQTLMYYFWGHFNY